MATNNPTIPSIEKHPFDARDWCEPDFDAPRPVAAIRFPAPVHAALRNPQTGEVCPLELADTTLLVMMIHCGWTFAQESEGR